METTRATEALQTMLTNLPATLMAGAARSTLLIAACLFLAWAAAGILRRAH